MLTYMLWDGQTVDGAASVVAGTLDPRSVGVAQWHGPGCVEAGAGVCRCALCCRLSGGGGGHLLVPGPPPPCPPPLRTPGWSTLAPDSFHGHCCINVCVTILLFVYSMWFSNWSIPETLRYFSHICSFVVMHNASMIKSQKIFLKGSIYHFTWTSASY